MEGVWGGAGGILSWEGMFKWKDGVPLPDTWGRGLPGALGQGYALLKDQGMGSHWQG